MVHGLSPADLAALNLIKGFDGLSAGMWLQIQDLMESGFSDKELASHEELSKLVKNILESTPKEGKAFSQPVKLLPTLEKLSPEVNKKLVSSEGQAERSAAALPAKSEKQTLSADPKSALMADPKEKLTSPTSQKSPPFLSKDSLLSPRFPLSQPQPSLKMADPLQQAVKEVVKALSLLLPVKEKRSEEPASERGNRSVPPMPKSAAAESMPKGQIAPSKEAKLDKKESTKVESQSSFGAPKEGKSVEKRSMEQTAKETPTTYLQAKPEAKVPAQITPFSMTPQAPLPLNRKAFELELTAQTKSAAQAPVTHIPPTPAAEKGILTAAPHQSQFNLSDTRRKEKKKYPHYFSDHDEEQEHSEQEQPKDK